jgi:hypothetical protein
VISILEKCKTEFKMNKRLSLLNSREISLQRLKLDLMSNLNIKIKLLSIFKTIIKFPSLLFVYFFKL